MSKLDDVARAICCDSGPCNLNVSACQAMRLFADDARAAIAALREPTEAQVRAVALASCKYDCCRELDYCRCEAIDIRAEVDCRVRARRAIAAYWDALEKEDGNG